MMSIIKCVVKPLALAMGSVNEGVSIVANAFYSTYRLIKQSDNLLVVFLYYKIKKGEC